MDHIHHHFDICTLIYKLRHAFQPDKYHYTMGQWILARKYIHQKYDDIFHHYCIGMALNNSIHIDHLDNPIRIDHLYILLYICTDHWIDHKCYRVRNYICVSNFVPRNQPYSLETEIMNSRWSHWQFWLSQNKLTYITSRSKVARITFTTIRSDAFTMLTISTNWFTFISSLILCITL